MSHIIRILPFLLTPIIVRGVIAYLRQPKQAEYGKVYMPKFLGILGLVACALLFIPAVITAFSDEPLWVSLLLPSSQQYASINSDCCCSSIWDYMLYPVL